MKMTKKNEVALHNFTKFSLIPSVSLVVDIPETVSDSWYDGQVLIGLKEGTSEPSSPLRHVTELLTALKERHLLDAKHGLFLYSDGGPEYRLTYLSVKLTVDPQASCTWRIIEKRKTYTHKNSSV